ncbi:MAG: phosphatidylserine decarboxylase [Lentisphaeria bacterium]|nr:phosphatidylserine decarboxylase [Candidatus Neomarinimicrobiota bacterium]MCF7842389.1 phosphatidylserine decarboxylase [Lentisphaeria bacterium]
MAREGLPNIVIALGLTALFVLMQFFFPGIVWQILAILSGLFLAFTLYFFRDPNRDIPVNDEHILSPGDGTIVSVKEVNDEYVGPAYLITMFLSPLNVHVNRVPIRGKIDRVQYKPGMFKAAFAADASEVNEQSVVCMSNETLKVKFSQISGVVARRIINYLRVGDSVQQGYRYGMIKFGSRMDVFVPRNCKVGVEAKDPVRGGLTVLARLKDGNDA